MENNSAATRDLKRLQPEAPAVADAKRQRCAAPPRLVPTQEQNAILTCDLPTGAHVAIEAGPGCGKTRTIKMLAAGLCRDARYRDWRMLYICFNRIVRSDAQAGFGFNVECSTVHAIAHKYFAHGRPIVPRVPRHELLAVLGMRNVHLVKATGDALVAYCKSADEEVSDEHIPTVVHGDAARRAVADAVDALVGRVYERRTTWVTFAIELKLLQLFCPQLGKRVIFIDEAQDFSGLMMWLVLHQENCAVVYVGDPYQRINAFLGTASAFEKMGASRALQLTHCFRFGANIARVAMRIKDTLFAEAPPGAVAGTPIHTDSAHRDCVVLDLEDALLHDLDADTGAAADAPQASAEPQAAPVATETDEECALRTADARAYAQGPLLSTAELSRTNAAVFEAAHATCVADPSCRIKVLGGTEQLLSDIRRNMNAWATNPHAFARTMDEVRATGDTGRLGVMRYVHRCMSARPAVRLGAMLERVARHATDEMALADAVVGTVHKAKGSEFECVTLSGDFKLPPTCAPMCAPCRAALPGLLGPTRAADAVTEAALFTVACDCCHPEHTLVPDAEVAADELRAYVDDAYVLYVAVTRAARVLCLSPRAIQILRWAAWLKQN